MPTKNFRLNRSKAISYEIELKLDHLRSHIYTLGNALIEGKEYDFFKLASDDVQELNELNVEIESCDITEAEKQELRQYILATESLLEKIRTWVK